METVTLENPLDIDLRRLAAKTFAEYAQLLVDEDSLDQATQALARAQTHAEVVQKQNAKDVLNLGALSSIHRNRGKVLGKQGKLDQAQRELLTALAIDERIASEGMSTDTIWPARWRNVARSPFGSEPSPMRNAMPGER